MNNDIKTQKLAEELLKVSKLGIKDGDELYHESSIRMSSFLNKVIAIGGTEDMILEVKKTMYSNYFVAYLTEDNAMLLAQKAIENGIEF